MLKIILTVLLMLPVPNKVPRQEHAAWLARVAPAIAHASRGDKRIAAYLIAMGTYESHFSERIQAGDCRGKECDGGKAHGMWQMHRDALPRRYHLSDITGTDTASLQTAADTAAQRIRGAIKMCGSNPLRVFSGYAQSCDRPPLKAAARVRLYKRVLRRLR